MKVVRSALLIAAILMFWIVSSYAIPIQDSSFSYGTVTFTNGTYGTTNGGEFLATVNGGGGDSNGSAAPNTYITFCLEQPEHLWYNSPFEISSIEDYAMNGGDGYDDASVGTELGGSDATHDYLNTATQWLFFNYLHLNNNNVFGAYGASGYSDTLANQMQNTIWYLEDEIDFDTLDASSKSFYNDVVVAATDYSFNGTVKVMNIVTSIYDSNNNLVTTQRQSQLVGDPVPEPATLLLMGLGLFGLATINRKKFFKKS